MIDAFEQAFDRVDVVIITGGLGPTKDDITKHVLLNYFDAELVENKEVLAHVKSFFEARGREMLDVNILQAYVPSNARVLNNEHGTAPGMWFEHEGKVVVSMPGVPYEMKHIMSEHVIAMLQERFQLDKLYYRTIQIQGIGESYFAERIKDMETEIRECGLSLAYLPSPGLVRLRISARDTRSIKQHRSFMTRLNQC